MIKRLDYGIPLIGQGAFGHLPSFMIYEDYTLFIGNFYISRLRKTINRLGNNVKNIDAELPSKME